MSANTTARPAAPLRVIDERNTPAAELYPLAVAGRPFAVQSRIGRKWLTIPGATYGTRAEANAAKGRIAL